MKTQDIRNEVARHAPSGRSIWPSCLGYSWRGWEYRYTDQGVWVASKGDLVGKGETPANAKTNSQQGTTQ